MALMRMTHGLGGTDIVKVWRTLARISVRAFIRKVSCFARIAEVEAVAA
jgi:hypothetical protein